MIALATKGVICVGGDVTVRVTLVAPLDITIEDLTEISMTIAEVD
jgi:hypothetical protein